jgi:hypothetical protein
MAFNKENAREMQRRGAEKRRKKEDRSVAMTRMVDCVSAELVASATERDPLEPYRTLPLEDAMPMLERLREFESAAGKILDERIGADRARQRCATCKKDLSKERVPGRPDWVSNPSFYDPKTGTHFTLYFCSNVCYNAWARRKQGAMGATAEA